LIQQRRGLKQHKIREKNEVTTSYNLPVGRLRIETKQGLKQNETMAVQTNLSMRALYDQDFVLWASKTAELLKLKKFDDVDWENLISLDRGDRQFPNSTRRVARNHYSHQPRAEFAELFSKSVLERSENLNTSESRHWRRDSCRASFLPRIGIRRGVVPDRYRSLPRRSSLTAVLQPS